MVLFFAQYCYAEPINPLHLRGSKHLDLQLRQNSDPPKIDSVASTKQYITAPANNKGAFWSGIPFPLSQSAAEAAGLQTLEQSVGTEITNHPEGQRGTATNPQFWDWFSEGFSDTIVESGSTEVTVLLRAPNRLLEGPSDPLTDGRMVSRSSKSNDTFPFLAAELTWLPRLVRDRIPSHAGKQYQSDGDASRRVRQAQHRPLPALAQRRRLLVATTLARRAGDHRRTYVCTRRELGPRPV